MNDVLFATELAMINIEVDLQIFNYKFIVVYWIFFITI
mgnify:CR=1 FL=1